MKTETTKQVLVQSRYSYQKVPGFLPAKDGRTQQQFRDEVNINSIMRRYKTTGILGDPTRQATMKPQFGDFTGVDFRGAQTQIAAAFQSFHYLPSQVRARFHNDPAEMVEFLNNLDNREEAIRLGMIADPVKEAKEQQMQNYKNQQVTENEQENDQKEVQPAKTVQKAQKTDKKGVAE